MADEGFQEIQLTGKQVVFLFMATTVIAAGIFLAGVLVGRGVQAEKASGGSEATLLSAPQVVPDPAAPATPAPASVTDPAAAPAPPPTDELSYYQRLQGESAPDEKLKSEAAAATSGAKPAEKAPASPPASPAPASPPPKAAASTAAKVEPPKVAPAKPATPPPAPTEPAGDGFVVQVASVRERAEADAIIKHLQGKGYSAFVLAPGAGSPVSTFRVRVGKFKARSEAEATARRLEKEEQYKPWVTR